MSSDRQADRFDHIVENIDAIREHLTHLDGRSLQAVPLVRDAVERCLSRVSEAVSILIRAGYDLNELDSSIAWRRIHGLGNWLRHRYPDIEMTIIEDTIANDLDPLRAVAAAERDRLDRDAGRT